MLTVSLVTHTNERKREAHRQEQHTQEVRRTAWGETFANIDQKRGMFPALSVGMCTTSTAALDVNFGQRPFRFGEYTDRRGGAYSPVADALMEDRVEGS